MAKIDPNDPRAPYQQIADDLRLAIKAGELPPGQRLTSSRDLAASYGVAAMTVHQAMRVLRDEGLVDSWQGRGVFVRDVTHEPETADLPTQIQEVRQHLQALTTRVDAGVSPEIEDLRRQVGLLQAQLIDLYTRTGHPYPHDGADATSEIHELNKRTQTSA